MALLRRIALTLLALLGGFAALDPAPALAANCPGFTYTLTNGTVADANQVMSNFNTLLNCANNNLAHNGVNSDITQLTGIVTPLSVSQGGTGFSTLTANSILLGNGASPLGTLVTSTTGAMPFWTGSAWGAATLIPGTGIGITNAAGGVTITATSASGVGFSNALRNSSMSSWFHGTSGTITTAGGWAAEGIWVAPSGASVTFAQQSNGSFAPAAFNYLQIIGAASVSDLTIRFPIESYRAAVLGGNAVTCQLPITQTTGGSITPTITVRRATAGQDNFTSLATDVNAQPMQTVGNGANAILAYTFTANGASFLGLSIDIDFGNNFGSNSNNVSIGGGFDCRPTPGVSTGINNSPPNPGIQDPAADQAWNARYFQSTYDNGTAGGAATHTGLVQIGIAGDSGGNGGGGVYFRTRMRCDPTMSYWDGNGNVNRTSRRQGAAWTDNDVTVSAASSSQVGAVFDTNTSSQVNGFVQYTADCTIAGG